jgi:Ribbon-helix-helix domain
MDQVTLMIECLMPKPPGLRKKCMSVYVEPAEREALQELSRRTHVPQQWYLREGLKLVLEHFRSRPPVPPP